MTTNDDNQATSASDDIWPKYRVAKHFDGYIVERLDAPNEVWVTETRAFYNYWMRAYHEFTHDIVEAKRACNVLVISARSSHKREAALKAFVPEYYYPPFEIAEYVEIVEPKRLTLFERVAAFFKGK